MRKLTWMPAAAIFRFETVDDSCKEGSGRGPTRSGAGAKD